MKSWIEIRRTFLGAGINLTEAAKLLHVTRQTLYNWNKNYNPCREQEDYNQVVIKRVELATQKGLLPLLPSEDRLDKLVDLLK